MDLERPKTSTTTKCRKLISMVQYYCDMWWQRHSHVMRIHQRGIIHVILLTAPLTEASAGKTGKSISWTDNLEQAFLDLKKMISEEETIHNYPD